jgi:molecular chaperone DnaJ
VADGQRIRLAGRGEPGRPPGDLYLLMSVKPDTVFGRDGDDLTLSVELTFAEAVLGVNVTVPTLDGAVTMRVPPGTPPGRILRVRGHGLPKRDGDTGDLLVTLDVAVPVKGTLSTAALAAIEQLATLTPPADRSLLNDAVESRMGTTAQ